MFDDLFEGVGERFDDGTVLLRAMTDIGLEGVVAKRDRDPYMPGERLWIKTKNRAAPRFAEERARALAGVEAARVGAVRPKR